MPKRIPDEELTPAQLKERERRRLYREKNREKIAAQKREYYLRNIDKVSKLSFYIRCFHIPINPFKRCGRFYTYIVKK